MMSPNRTIGRMPRAEQPSIHTIQKATVRPPAGRWGMKVPTEVTPDGLRRALMAARRGKPGPLFGVYEFFHKLDDEIPGALGSLIEAVLQSGPVVTPVDESDEAQRQAEDVEEILDTLDLVELIREGLESRYYGMAAIWPQWDVYRLASGRTVQAPITYELLPRDWIYADRLTETAEHTTLYVGDRPYHEYPAGALLLFTAKKLPSFADIDFTSFGVGLAAARFAVYGYFTWEDWAGYTEVFGSPAIIGTLLEGWKPQDKELLEKAVFGMSNDARGILTDKAKLDTIDAPGGEGPFAAFGDAARKAIARTIKGESLTDNMGDRGSYAAMQTTNGIRLDFARGLARRVSRMMMRRLVEPICELNFGKTLVELQIPVKEVRDLVQESTVDRNLLDMGVELSLAEVRERYGRTAPADEDDTLARTNGGGLPGLDLFGG